ncbi:MAG: hypothetical protein RSE12_17085 [Fuscovulum sp.]|nr:MAG: hypothetical protein RSE12_17085 [Fuscovulum sp.]
MPFMTIIEGGVSLLYCNGVFRQANLYHRNGDVYAKWGAGFVRLGAGGATSHPNVKWREVDTGNAGMWRENIHRVEFIPAATHIEMVAA